VLQFKFPPDSNRVHSLGNLGVPKRTFRIVKRENNIPVLGVCEHCNAEFAEDPETIGRPKDAHAHIQKQFIAHKCTRLDASQESRDVLPVVNEGAPNRTGTIPYLRRRP
jgi:hypothetical protein